MSDLPVLLLASLQPTTRKEAEQNLQAFSVQPGFLSHLLRLVLTPTVDRPARLAGSVYLKNTIKNRWDDEETPVAPQDKAALRSELVPAMIALSDPADKSTRAQVAEAVSLVAAADFPEQWSDLIDQLVASLSLTDYSINIGVLETAHSIFRPWRAQVRSDALFTTINFVLSRFVAPFLKLLRHTASLLLSGSAGQNTQQLALTAQAMRSLVEIFYDLTCQDLPPDIEDAHLEFWGPEGGIFLSFLGWDPVELRGDPDEPTPSLPSQIKTAILEIAEMYTKLYPEMMSKVPTVEAVVRGVWDLLGAGKLGGVADDGFVSQSLRFISSTIRSGHYKQLFGTRETISGLVQGVVVPNVLLREHELEQFEDDPLEFVRLDLNSSIGDAVTRRQASADVLRALVASGLEAETTAITREWINMGLNQYGADRNEGWKAKDSAIYLLTAVAARGGTAQQGVTSTNALVDVVDFFSQNVYQDLQADTGSVHPILQVDAIRFLYTFRNQLTKQQLLSVLPLLLKHINSSNYVCYTYAAITIERILFIKQGTQLLFSQADIHDSAHGLLDALLSKIEAAGTPEKIAENDYLMKSAMRIIITARQTLTPSFERTLQRLVAILGQISKNPSNPNFDQYIFESISALMRFVVSGTPATLPAFEQALFGPFTFILQQDIDQYIPYVFQILAQMLELHTTDVPAEYRSLLPFLLTPAMWQQKGSVPGLVKLLTAFLAHDSRQMVAQNQYIPVLAVIQQRLIPSKLNDGWGFELLQAVIRHIPPTDLKPHFRAVIITLLTRLQTSKTDNYVYRLTYFLLYSMAIQVDGLTPDYIISTVEEVQPQLWSQILANVLIPQIPKMAGKDRKVAVVGATRMLTQSSIMFTDPSASVWPGAFTAMIRLFSEPQYLTKSAGEEDPDAGLTSVDYEEQTAGYQAAYSRLAASEKAPQDPAEWVRDPKEYLTQELGRAASQNPRVSQLVSAADQGVVANFVQNLRASGVAI